MNDRMAANSSGKAVRIPKTGAVTQDRCLVS